MSMFDYNPEGPWTFVSGAAIAANTLVKLNGSGQCINSVSGDLPIGWVADAATGSGVTMTVYPLIGNCKVTGGGVTAVGDYIKCGAAGKFVVETSPTTPTAFTIGQSMVISADTVVSDIFARP